MASEQQHENPIRQIVRARLRAITVLAVEEDVTLDHQPTRGALREAALLRLMGQLLPSGTSARSGFITSLEGEVSHQLDLCIVSDKLVQSPMVTGSTSIIPIEAALGVVEVKTNLTVGSFKQVKKQATEVQRSKFLGKSTHPCVQVTIPFYLIGFGGPQKPETVVRWFETKPPHPWLRGVCVLASYSIIKHAGTGKLTAIEAQDDTPFDETLAFFAIISRETIRSASLRTVFPDALARYLSDEGYSYDEAPSGSPN